MNRETNKWMAEGMKDVIKVQFVMLQRSYKPLLHKILIRFYMINC